MSHTWGPLRSRQSCVLPAAAISTGRGWSVSVAEPCEERQALLKPAGCRPLCAARPGLPYSVLPGPHSGCT